MKQFHKSHIKKEYIPLVEKYPDIFFAHSDRNANYYPEEERCNLRFGFEHGPGWFKILDEFCADITELVNWQRQLGNPDCYVRSCITKEKFGILAIQWDANFKNQIAQKFYYSRVSSAESASAYTCELTGKYGKTRNINAWMTTLCYGEFVKYCQERGVKYISKNGVFAKSEQNSKSDMITLKEYIEENKQYE